MRGLGELWRWLEGAREGLRGTRKGLRGDREG